MSAARPRRKTALRVWAGALSGPLTVFALSGLGACAAAPPSYRAQDGLQALPDAVVYQGGAGPLSYQPGTALSAERVKGSACQRGFTIPFLGLFWMRNGVPVGPNGLSFGWGEGTFAEVTRSMLASQPPGSTLSDVRADVRTRVILSVYRERCLELDAAVVRPAQPVTDPAPAQQAGRAAGERAHL